MKTTKKKEMKRKEIDDLLVVLLLQLLPHPRPSLLSDLMEEAEKTKKKTNFQRVKKMTMAEDLSWQRVKKRKENRERRKEREEEDHHWYC